MEKNKEMPIGIKYYFSDPFVSKINSDEVKQYEIVYRKDIHNFRFREKRILLDKMRNVNMSILDYSNKISQNNAQERLYLLTKNCGLDNNRSTPWKYMPNLERCINLYSLKDDTCASYVVLNQLVRRVTRTASSI